MLLWVIYLHPNIINGDSWILVGDDSWTNPKFHYKCDLSNPIINPQILKDKSYSSFVHIRDYYLLYLLMLYVWEMFSEIHVIFRKN